MQFKSIVPQVGKHLMEKDCVHLIQINGRSRYISYITGKLFDDVTNFEKITSDVALRIRHEYALKIRDIRKKYNIL